jgi:hypothetical protein
MPRARFLTRRGFSGAVLVIHWVVRRIRAMAAAVKLREDYSVQELGALANRSKDARQSRTLVSLTPIRVKPIFGTPHGTGVGPTGGIATQTPTEKMFGNAGFC